MVVLVEVALVVDWRGEDWGVKVGPVSWEVDGVARAAAVGATALWLAESGWVAGDARPRVFAAAVGFS